MQISDEGLRLIKRCEGYGKALPDGSCTAYEELINGKRDIPTIGYGCTKNVKMGMVWTEDQAETELRRELTIHEKRVARLVTVDLNQHQFDCLVSFDFNTGGLTLADGKPSGVLKAVNASDWNRVADQLKLWNKFGGKPSKGLIARRAEEIALFMRPMSDVGTDYMPQRVEPSREPLSRKIVATATTVGATGATYVSTAGIPPPPDLLKTTAVNVGAWKGLASGADHLTMAGLAIVICAVAWFAYDKWRAE